MTRLALRDIRFYWSEGFLKKDGEVMTEQQAYNAIVNKQKKIGLPPLKNDEIIDIIYRDPTKYRQKARKEDLTLEKMKQLSIKEKGLEITRLKEERLLVEARTRQTIAQEFENPEIVTKLMKESKPSDFCVDFYQRIDVKYVIIAIQLEYPKLNDAQAKKIIGSWIRRGL